jgi:Flp pilus assembly pilin Flp
MDATVDLRKPAASREGRFSLLCASLRRFLSDTGAQDLMEYALMAGFVGTTAAATLPNIATSLSLIFSKVSSVMTAAASQN